MCDPTGVKRNPFGSAGYTTVSTVENRTML